MVVRPAYRWLLPALKFVGYFLPSAPHRPMRLEQHSLLLPAPLFLAHSGVQMVMPSTLHNGDLSRICLELRVDLAIALFIYSATVVHFFVPRTLTRFIMISSSWVIGRVLEGSIVSFASFILSSAE